MATVAGKAVVNAFYDEEADRSYFMGCSTGGRQALIAAQRYPNDFDGIIAGAPVVHFATYMVDLAWPLLALTDEDGKAVLSERDAEVLHKAVVDQCDADDGLIDGIIGNPLACKLDPAVLACTGGRQSSCLTAAQIEAVERVYAGPATFKSQRAYPQGAIPGSEVNWVAQGPTFLGSGRALVMDGFRFMVLTPAPGPSWQLPDFDILRDADRLQTFASLATAHNPDLREFAANGGKLIAYFGWRDPSPPEIIDYYEMVERIVGGRSETQEFFRLFMLPGVDHCTGGAGAFAVDYLKYLDEWVENGRAPDVMIGAHVPGADSANGSRELVFPLEDDVPVLFTRPFFPYPIRAVYDGKGDPNDASSFVPVP